MNKIKLREEVGGVAAELYAYLKFLKKREKIALIRSLVYALSLVFSSRS